LLYAGTALLNCFNYFILNDIVKKLEQRSQSAGNIVNGTSETLRDEIVINSENVKRISDHVPKHSKPLNDQQLGYYLAGLIDGKGHFNNIPQLVIIFNSLDVFLAYYLKKAIGFGNVRKVKDKNVYLLIITNKEGLLRVINLINGKLRTTNKYDQLINNVLIDKSYSNIKFTLNTTNDLNNH
jgi:hypothetical protein